MLKRPGHESVRYLALAKAEFCSVLLTVTAFFLDKHKNFEPVDRASVSEYGPFRIEKWTETKIKIREEE